MYSDNFTTEEIRNNRPNSSWTWGMIAEMYSRGPLNSPEYIAMGIKFADDIRNNPEKYDVWYRETGAYNEIGLQEELEHATIAEAFRESSAAKENFDDFYTILDAVDGNIPVAISLFGSGPISLTEIDEIHEHIIAEHREELL